MNPTLLSIAISAAIAGSAGFGAAWTLQGRTIDALKIEAKDERIEQQRASRQVADRLANQVIAAQNAAAARVSRNAADSRSAASSGNGLRLTSEAAVRAATTDTDACGSVVAAYGVVVDAVSREAERLAATADQCLSDNQALVEAWPKFNFTDQTMVK